MPYFLQKHKNANPLNINLLFLKISDMNQAMSDILQVFEVDDIFIFWMDI